MASILAGQGILRFAARYSTVAGLMIVGSGSQRGVECSEDHIPSIEMHWSHHGALRGFDAKAVRRGFQVYKEVCASCHSVNRLAFRNLVEYGAWTEEEAKAIAEEAEIMDGPNDEGEMFERPCKLSDSMPGPYANDEAARAANNGALPPDLSLIIKARHGGADYVFNLLNGYCEAPAGKQLLPGLYYNPYFAGGAIGMPAPLMDESVTYPDGTPATVSQMAKDVSVFLAWAAEPEHDERKKAGFRWILALSIAAIVAGFTKRFRWAPLKARKISYNF
mmetsp:Transcript_7758/g.10810  ORF Transcript_7758/g.10810 Transcript_7758/m.10810 type:complete len:277 (-) Transcript_7758:283-1113(-)|eukprot:CAMPEP_0197291612 /NCGR_PEP_ID=MMETSP0890-20130614/17515_1 /TAXON_ID=44058 ORGANISM="Aureoumbra lagunensis, Strain CCMP1510" /NCGR_SAMPLE_ID=MMETSP0890 /ASSEMBLY_ACC=CAM_ASM_000533 /LENGTH=276 /DNA_ID=CAMNT_0042764817 /DNA_START=22 /DNA_END=852 /DNA_ORIENTATION=+